MKPVLDLNDIHVFVAVVDAGSMSSAAKTLAVPKSTISRSLARLQDHLGLSLFRCGRSGVVLTDAGQEYLPSCRNALRLLQDGRDAINGRAAQPAGTVRVACPVTMAREVMSKLAPLFSKRYPSLTIEIVSYTTHQNAISDEAVDVFFQMSPPRKKTGGARCYPSARRGVYTSRSYASFAGIPQKPEELASFRCLGSRSVPAFAKWHLHSEEREVSLELDFHTIAAEVGTLRNLMLQGMGITILPVWMALQEGTKEEVIRVLPEWEFAPATLSATYAQPKHTIPKLRLFLDFMDEYLGTSLDPRAAGEDVQACFAPASN